MRRALAPVHIASRERRGKESMKSKSFGIMIVGFVLLAFMAITMIFFIVRAHIQFHEDFAITVDGVTEKTLSVPSLQLVPGSQKDYDVHVKCEATGLYEVEVFYYEKHNGGLKNFVNAVMMLGDEQVHEGALGELIDGEPVKFDWTFEEDEEMTLTISYEMPIEIGNEAKGTSASFDVKLKITKK